MRILQVHNRYQQSGGEDTVVAAERQLLSSAGHHVDLYQVDNDGIGSLMSKLLTAARVAYSRPARDRLRGVLATARPDVVHVHNLFPLLTPSILDACRDEGVPVVQTLHNFRYVCAGALLLRDGRPCEDCLHGSAYQAALHGCYRGSRAGSLAVAHMIETHRRRGTWHDKVARFIALTEFGRERFSAAGFPADRIVVKPNFVADAGPPRADGPRRGGLFVGRLSPEKGVDHLIEAWRDIDHPLTVIGDGPDGARLRAMAPPTVVFLGAVGRERVRQEMERAAMLFMPSIWYETFGMVVVEAMAAGLPVMASRIGGLPELVQDGRTGLLVDPGNPAAWRHAARCVLQDPERLRAMGTHARSVFEGRFSARENLRLLEGIYRSVSGV